MNKAKSLSQEEFQSNKKWKYEQMSTLESTKQYTRRSRNGCGFSVQEATHSFCEKVFTIKDPMGLEVGMGVFSERREKKSFQAEKSIC